MCRGCSKRREGGENMSTERLFQLRLEAVALITKGGLSAKIGRAFLKSNAGA